MANLSITQIFRRAFNALTDRIKVEVGASVLPSGAATEATLEAMRTELFSSSGVVTPIAASTSVQTALAANSSRRGFFLFNATNKDVLIKFGASASASSYTFVLGGGGFYERELTNYRGIVTVIWPSASAGNLYATELT